MSAFANLIPYLSLIQRSLPKEILWTSANYTGKLLASIQHKRRKVLENNLATLGMQSLNTLSERIIQNWTLCISDQIRSLWMKPWELQKIVTDQWSDNLVRDKGVILVSAHLGNYELGGSYLASFGLPIYAVVEDIPGGHSRILNRIRGRFGMGVVISSDLTRMMNILRQGKILVLLADRDFSGAGLKCKFGLGIRKIPQGPALLAERTGAVIQPAYCPLRRDRKSYTLIVKPPLRLKMNGSLKEKTIQLTKLISDELAATCSKYSDQWFVFESPPPSPLQNNPQDNPLKLPNIF